GRMQRLVHDLLELAKLENNAYPLAITHLVYAQLIEDVLMTYRPILSQQQITLATELDPELIIEADQNRIEQVLHNLLDNAIRYTPKHGTIRIGLRATSNTHCELSISDTGIGIAPEHLPHISEPFYRANKARTRKDGGTGLGLAIVSNIVAMHGGTLALHSIEHEGTTATIALPRYRET
ncbi:sensor histidine kinase, partial [Paenibacillus sp.]